MMPLKNKNVPCTKLLLELQSIMLLKKQKCAMYLAIVGTPEHDSIKKSVTHHVTCTQLLLQLQNKVPLKMKRDMYSAIVGTPKHDLQKHQCREQYSKIIGTTQHIIRKQQMQSYTNAARLTSNSNQRIVKFTKQIQEGPYYVCVVCNRCHYFRSVILFKQEKYDIDRHRSVLL